MNTLGISAETCNGKECKLLDYGMLRKIGKIKINLPEPIEKESIDLRTKFYVKFNTISHESVYAGNVFPCFDEPIFKTTLKISLQIKKVLLALSNLRVKNIDQMDDGTKIVNFESTMHMSTYLVAFVVGEFCLI
uniref:Peptidase_M1_N domain-containing protein n=1 Tax=Parastrongyloides trichosuri TaxID=131310 RepID=A0A0N4ZWB8_PARTI